MRCKKTIGFLLTLALMVGLLIPTALAAKEPTLSLSSGSVKAGQSVVLTLSIKDNPGIATSTIYFYYDTSVFSVDPEKDIAAAGVFASQGGAIGNTISLAKKNGVYAGKSGKDGVLALWYNGTGTNTTGDGAVMQITLHTVSGAVNGSYTVEADCAKNATYNEKSELVVLGTASATVTVTVTGGTDAAPGNQGGSQTGGTQTGSKNPYSDVSGHWAEDYILEATERGITQGYQGLYRPNDTMTRGEFVTILWRASGSPAPKKAASFTDLTQDWYKDAVAWAEEQGVVNGTGNGKFDPTGYVTREQIATILHRQAGKPTGMEMMLTGLYDQQYSDSESISSWAKAGLYWSIYKGVYCGENGLEIGANLAPKANGTRGQIAVMIVRYLEL